MKRNIHLLGLITWLVIGLLIPDNARPPVLALQAENELSAPQILLFIFHWFFQ